MLDPAGGSWYVEDLTEALAQQAWSHFQAIESRGGFTDAHDFIAAHLEQVSDQRSDDVDHRRTKITGVNEYPNLDEQPLPQTGEVARIHRYATDFEALRDRSDASCSAQVRGHGCCCCRWARLPSTTSGPRSRRTCWRPAVSRPSTPDRSTRRASTPRSRKPAARNIAIICGTDARYGSEVAGVVRAAHAAGITAIYLAGPRKAVADIDQSQLPDEYLTASIDAVHALSNLLGRLGA